MKRISEKTNKKRKLSKKKKIILFIALILAILIAFLIIVPLFDCLIRNTKHTRRLQS